MPLYRGTSGNDTFHGSSGIDVLRGLGGNDTLYGGDGSDVLFGDAGDDALYGGEGDDILIGGEGEDVLHGGTGRDTFMFGDNHGNDIISDFVIGEDMIDLTDVPGVSKFADLTITEDGTDVLVDTGQGVIRLNNVDIQDVDASIFAFELSGGDGNDELYGGAGQEEIFGRGGADTLDGGSGNDRLFGGDGNDRLFGGDGDDTLFGNAGNDTLYGGGGNDTLGGGAGNDTFVFGLNRDNDTIKDFTNGEDRIDLTAIGGISGFEHLTVSQDGDDVVIAMDSAATNVGTGTITLEDFSLDDLDGNDFLFAEPSTPIVSSDEL